MEGLNRLERAITYLRSDVYEELPIQQIAMILKVAANEGITQQKLGEALKMPSGTTSRNIRMLSQFADKDKDGVRIIKGHNILDSRPSIEERTKMSVWLTAKGKEVMSKLDEIILGER